MESIETVAVVGAGYMGKGIAQCLALGGAAVRLADVDEAVARAALDRLVEDTAAAEREGLLDVGTADTVASRTGWAPSMEAAAEGADFVIEAVFERIDIKHAVLRRIESAARPDAIIASNTSSIPIAELASALSRPERFFGVHWFNPAPYLPGVEVILSDASDRRRLPAIMELLGRAGKEPAAVADSPGFLANRLQFALFREAALVVEEGLATPAEVDTVVRSSFGFRLPFFGPFAIADMAGLDVYAEAFRTLERSFGPRFSIPSSLAAFVDRGALGVKSGEGYLGLTDEEAAALVERRDRSYAALLRLRRELGQGDADSHPSRESSQPVGTEQ